MCAVSRIRPFILFLLIGLTIFSSMEGSVFTPNLEEMDWVKSKEGKEFGEESETEEKRSFNLNTGCGSAHQALWTQRLSVLFCRRVAKAFIRPRLRIYLLYAALLFYH